LNHIFSPWRMEYIQSDKHTTCAFCEELAKPDGTENLIVFRGRRAFIILNRYPYTSGHLMIVPFQHESTLDALDEETRVELMSLTNRAIEAIKSVYHPQGFNVGINIGEAAGAGITEHIHVHVVPRWIGDTNFMSSLSETRVLPETLEETYERVVKAWGECQGKFEVTEE
jgi:ATP adenylyltransferase